MDYLERFVKDSLHSQNNDQAYWKEKFEEENLTPDSTYPDRIRVCYRLTREFARWKGIVTDLQTLAEGTCIHPDPWNSPYNCLVNKAPSITAASIENNIQLQKLELPMLPPPKQEDDKLLKQFIMIMGRLAVRLNVIATAEGRKGLKWILSPSMCQEIWPKAEVMMAWEEVMIQDFLENQVEMGTMAGTKACREKHHLTVREANCLAGIARARAPDMIANSLEQDKALMIMRLDGLVQRCKDSQDIGAELRALKLMTLIQQIHKADVMDDIDEMAQVVAEESSKADKELKQISEKDDG